MFEGSLCVCCMSTNDLIDLFEPCTVGDNVVIYGEMLSYALNVKFNQNENSYICTECANELRQVHAFAHKTYTILAILDPKKVPAHHFKHLKMKEEYLEDDGDYTPPKPKAKRRKVRGRKPKYAVTVLPSKKFVVPKVLNTDRVCAECGESFPCAKTLSSHYNEHFPRYACDICSRAFASRSRLTSHMRTHREGPFACDVCGEVKENLNTLDSHKRMKHSESKALFPCELCSVECKGYILRRRHMFTKHGVDTYNYHCKLCGKKFIASSLLRKHIKLIHLKICDYQCPECGRGFKDKVRLKNHLEHAHNVGEKSYQCEYCEKKFSRKYTLKNHILIHTNERNYHCLLCQSKFVYKCVLKSHIAKHVRRDGISQEMTEYLLQSADIKINTSEDMPFHCLDPNQQNVITNLVEDFKARTRTENVTENDILNSDRESFTVSLVKRVYPPKMRRINKEFVVENDVLESTNVKQEVLINSNVEQGILESTKVEQDVLDNSNVEQDFLVNSNVEQDFLVNSNVEQDFLVNSNVEQDVLVNSTVEHDVEAPVVVCHVVNGVVHIVTE